MKPTKSFLRSLSLVSLFVTVGLLIFLSGCKPNCQQCKDAGCCGGGGVAIAISGNVKEEFAPPTMTTSKGDTAIYNSGKNSMLQTTAADGTFGASPNTQWDQVSPVSFAACKNKAIDEIIYQQLVGPNPNVDVQNQTFIILKATGNIPVTVTAQNLSGTAYGHAKIEIYDGANDKIIGAPCTGDPGTGACSYGTQLVPNTVYWLHVTNEGGTVTTQFQFNTGSPNGTTGQVSSLRIFARFS